MRFRKTVLLGFGALIVASIFAVILVVVAKNQGIAHSEKELLDLLRKEEGLSAECELVVLNRFDDLLCVEDVGSCEFYILQITEKRGGWKIGKVHTMFLKDDGSICVFPYKNAHVILEDNPTLTTILIRWSGKERRINVENHPSAYYVEDPAKSFETLFLDKDGNNIGP